MHWVREAFRRSFDYSGRSRRMEYWSYALFWAAAMILISYVEDQLGLSRPRGTSGRSEGGPLSALATLGLIVPGFAVAVRRLHDTDRVGWWLALPAAPLLFWIVALIAGFDSPALFTPVLIAIILTPLLILAFMCLPGTKGPNRFGPDPKGSDLADIFG